MNARPLVAVRPELVAFDTRPYRHRLGLRPTDVWIDRDEARAHDVGVKADRIESEPDRVRLGRDRAVGERVAAALSAPGTPPGDGQDPLLAVCRGLQEDIVVLERIDDTWVFTSGVVCFPTAWEPLDKVGRGILEIHGPVPEYAEQVGEAVDRSLDRLAVGPVQWRRNWSVTTCPDLWLRPDRTERDVADVGGDVWLRIERQTFRKLDTDTIVFGIRIHLWPLAIALGPDDAAGLAVTIRSIPASFAAYKELLSTHSDQLLEWLDARSVGAI